MEKLTGNLTENTERFSTLFHAPRNSDFVVRTFSPHGIKMAVFYVDGMAQRTNIEESILRPLMLMPPFGNLLPADRSRAVMERVLQTGTAELSNDTEQICEKLLAGFCAVLCDGSAQAVLVELQGFETRGVEKPVNESVVFGPHQAFNESLRTNLTMLHRLLHTTDLVAETFPIGELSNTKTALVYLDGVADPAVISEARRRLTSIKVDKLLSAGQLQQLLEDHPYRLMPQMQQTERPDRAASFLTDGMVVILCDNAPYALAAPSVFLTFLHTPDDHALRWQYGSFLRVVRLFGFFIALLLPSLYNALLLYHQELLPIDLLTSLMEGYALVPLSVSTELIIMDFFFDLINEASLRVPGSMGSTLGIVGGLILGQAAVSASLISPMLIIVVSVAGLGLFAVPSYPLSLALRICRLILILASTLSGFVGIILVLCALLCSAARLESFGMPYFAPIAPKMRRNHDLFTRGPVGRQKWVPGMAHSPRIKAAKSPRGWEEH